MTTLGPDLRALLDEHTALADERFLEGNAVLPGVVGYAGQTVGAYTLVSPIGEGGMGSVWLAARSDGRFDRRAAVKFLGIALPRRHGVTARQRRHHVRFCGTTSRRRVRPRPHRYQTAHHLAESGGPSR